MTEKALFNGDMMAIALDVIDQELHKALPPVVDAEYMKKATPAELSLVKIALILYRCKKGMK